MNILKLRGEINTTWCVEVAAMLIITVITVAGNIAVMIALRRLQRSPAHYPLASLAAADLLVGVFVLPIAAARELFVFQLNWVICSCWSTLDVLCCTASILSLCTLGWERWCCITAPLARAKRCQKAKLLAVLVWPISTAVALPTAFIPSPKHYHDGEMPKACTVNTNVGYVFFSISLSFYIPASVMVGFYICILRLLSLPLPIRAHRGRPCERADRPPTNRNEETENPTLPQGNDNEIAQQTQATASPKGCHLNAPAEASGAIKTHLPKVVVSLSGLIPKQRRATRTIIMLMSLFLACWTPFFIMLPVDSLCECVWDVTWLWCTWLGYANSAFNPLVYAAASPSVRRALQATLTTSSSARTTVVPLSPSVRRP
ncbi:octopamine receptor-like isoform X2 [Galleria mellonella]|uniref:Octopamine receptor-like isoform X2 n=1 Tax=Galleria mellonella TaxID=7137 RepID=A0A6J3C8N0_GALME|nr:octopamine receptor-like isoform X2 [Galleria mellonella]